MAIRHAQHPCGQAVLPLQALDALALRTLAVAAGKVLIARMATFPVNDPAAAKSGGAASPDGTDQADGARIRAEGSDILLPIIAEQLPYRICGR